MKTLTRNVLKLAKLASKNESRPVITGVYFDGEKAVVTDTYFLAEIRCSASGFESSEFPKIGDQVAVNHVKPCILDSKGLLDVLKVLPKKRQTLPILNTAAVMDQSDKEVQIGTTDLEKSAVTRVRVIDGNYPAYEKVFPKKKPVASIAIDKKVLQKALDSLPEDQFTLHVFDGDKPPLVLTNDTFSGEKVRAMVMPLSASSASSYTFKEGDDNIDSETGEIKD